MLGVILFIEALMTYMALKGHTVTLRFGQTGAVARPPTLESPSARPPPDALEKAPLRQP